MQHVLKILGAGLLLSCTSASADDPCPQAITYGKSPTTGNWVVFPSICDIPDGWTSSTTEPANFTPYITAAAADPCVAIANDLDFTLSCAVYQGERYRLSFKERNQPRIKLNQNRWRVDGITPLSDDPANTLVAVTGEYDGKTVEIRPGATLQITLPSNPTTGYGWVLAQTNDRVLSKIGSSYVSECPADTPMTGCGGHEVWEFQVLMAGDANLVMEYVRPWDSDAVPERNFSLTVRGVDAPES